MKLGRLFFLNIQVLTSFPWFWNYGHPKKPYCRLILESHVHVCPAIHITSHASFSSPQATLLLVSTKNHNLWPGPIFWTCPENPFCTLSQSDLSDLTLSMCRVTGSPWIADFQCQTLLEVAILGADQNENAKWMQMLFGLIIQSSLKITWWTQRTSALITNSS